MQAGVSALITSKCKLFQVWGSHGVRKLYHSHLKIYVWLQKLSLNGMSPIRCYYSWVDKKKNLPGIARISWAKRERFGNCEQHPAHHWIGSQTSKSSAGNFQNSASSSLSAWGCLLYHARKLTFWGEPELAESVACTWVDADSRTMVGGASV